MELATLKTRLMEASGPEDFGPEARTAGRFSVAEADDMARVIFGPDWTLADQGILLDALGGSVDAALELVSRKLPDANCYGVEREPKYWTAYVSRNHVSKGHWLKEATAPTAPLALLIALVTALIAENEE